MKITKGTLRAKLSRMKQDASPLEREVIKEIMRLNDTDDEIKGFFSDLFQHGCVSGMVSGLIYYSDTIPFAKRNIEEIMELLSEAEENIGEPLKMSEPRLNWLAWFGFEETARKVAEKLNIQDF